MKSLFLFLHVIWKLGVNIESPWEEPQTKRPEHHRWVQQTDHSSSLVERQTQEWKEDPEMFGTHFKACNVKPDWLEGQWLQLHWPQTPTRAPSVSINWYIINFNCAKCRRAPTHWQHKVIAWRLCRLCSRRKKPNLQC